MTTKKAISGEPPSALLLALRKVLRPLVRLLLSFKIAFPQLAEMLKSVYVEVANEEFRLPNKAQTDTRLSLLTGIHRKDIKRLKNQVINEKEVPMVINVGARLVARWVGEKMYQDAQGLPLVLPQKAKGAPSFEQLVVDVCKQDIRPRVILDEWLNLGIVTIDADKKVNLNTQAFIPQKGLDEKSFFLGHNIADHLASATHNLLNQQPPFFERCVYYDGLSSESIEQLHQLVSEKGMDTLVTINELAMKLKAQDMVEPHHQHRINIGLYVYHEVEKNKHE